MLELWRHLVGYKWSRPRHRDEYVLWWGVIHIMFAIILFTTGPIEAASYYIHLAIDPPWWGLLALWGGATAIITSMRRGASLVPAFALLAALLAGRAAGHLVALAALGDLRQVASAILWLVLLRIHLVVATWPNPQPVRLDPVILSEGVAAGLAQFLMDVEEGDPRRERVQRALYQVIDGDDVE